MRYELSDYEWSVIRPMLPNKPRCIPRVENELEICTEQEPELKFIAPDHKVRCWLYE